MQARGRVSACPRRQGWSSATPARGHRRDAEARMRPPPFDQVPRLVNDGDDVATDPTSAHALPGLRQRRIQRVVGGLVVEEDHSIRSGVLLRRVDREHQGPQLVSRSVGAGQNPTFLPQRRLYVRLVHHDKVVGAKPRSRDDPGPVSELTELPVRRAGIGELAPSLARPAPRLSGPRRRARLSASARARPRRPRRLPAASSLRPYRTARCAPGRAGRRARSCRSRPR